MDSGTGRTVFLEQFSSLSWSFGFWGESREAEVRGQKSEVTDQRSDPAAPTAPHKFSLGRRPRKISYNIMSPAGADHSSCIALSVQKSFLDPPQSARLETPIWHFAAANQRHRFPSLTADL